MPAQRNVHPNVAMEGTHHMEAGEVPARPPHAEPFLRRLMSQGLAFAWRRSPEPEDDMQDGMFLLLGKLDANPELWNNPKKAQLLLFGIIKHLSRHTVRHDAVLERDEAETGREMMDNQSQVGTPQFDMHMRHLQGLLLPWIRDP